jgi:hypothetical protein
MIIVFVFVKIIPAGARREYRTKRLFGVRLHKTST